MKTLMKLIEHKIINYRLGFGNPIPFGPSDLSGWMEAYDAVPIANGTDKRKGNFVE